MIGRLAALIVLSASVAETQDIPQQISVIVTEPGDSVTLTCPIFGDKAGLFYWYKLNFGHMVQTVATGTFVKIALTGQFDNSRFSVTRTDAQYHLTIRTVSKEDEATYFCQAGSAYTMGFTNGTVLTVNGKKTVYVEQTPETELVQLGDSVTLQCSLVSKNKENSIQCPGEHSIYILTK
uniref:Ig-like domain-containing protein n=1 Tax=Mastacembelus armatus TaxID=205130 RepID=A0A3Q3SLJ9_9TELE